ncbi:MAG: caspase family protein [Pseudanabaena sp. ELA607]
MARYGLIVGVAKYKSPLGNLSKTESDANAVNDLLKQHGDFEDIQVLTGDVTTKQLENALGQLLLERADRNEALIYFSGHAVVVKGNFGKKRGYFALSNTGLKTSSGEITGIENGIALDDLSGLIGEAKLSSLVVLLDCCHSETLLEESQGFLQRAIVTQAFAELKQDYFLVSACRKFEEAYAMKSESYSIFTGAVLRGLARDHANERGVVDASTMFGYVAEQLRETGQEAVSFGYGRALRIVDYRSISQDIVEKQPEPSPKLNQQDYRDRQIMLNKVRNYWVKGVLETSIHEQALIELGLQTRIDVIANPWHLEWATSDQARKLLPAGTKAISQFDQLGAGRALLILGAPGAGKTTTLLELTRELIVRAEQDSELSMPIVFNLSSWQDKQSLADWMVLELNIKYQVPKKIGKTWVSEQQLLLMLDGLDEVSSDRRNACVEAINHFHGEYGQTEIVVCSRMKDYEALTQRLQFQGAIFIQPLEEAQVFEYFDRLGAELAGVREMLTMDAKLLELAQTPLMANIIAITYRGMSVTDLIKMSLSEDHVRHLFDAYIDCMLRRRPNKRYAPNKVKRWLGFLATQLKNESQTVFLIERIQPSWLQNSTQATLYAAAFVIIPSLLINESTSGFFLMPGLIIALTYGLMYGNFRWWVSILSFASCFTFFPFLISLLTSAGITSVFTISTPEFMLVSYGLPVTFEWGILFSIAGLLSGTLFAIIQKKSKSHQFSNFQFSLIASPFWLAYFVSNVAFKKLTVIDVSYSLTFFLMGNGLLSYILWGTLVAPINPLQKFKWSWQSAKESASKGMIWGLIIGVISGLISGFLAASSDENKLGWTILGFNSFFSDRSEITPFESFDQLVLMIFFGVTSALVFALIAQPICALIWGIIGGYRGETISTTTTPNQGIWRSFRRNLILVPTIAPILGIIYFILSNNESIPFEDLYWIVIWYGTFGFVIGLLIALFSGGAIVIKHFILRILLFSSGKIPWNYAKFLNYTTDCILLQKIGGGYVFGHRLLLEHFSQIYDERG